VIFSDLESKFQGHKLPLSARFDRDGDLQVHHSAAANVRSSAIAKFVICLKPWFHAEIKLL